jgi:hypothetical protein
MRATLREQSDLQGNQHANSSTCHSGTLAFGYGGWSAFEGVQVRTQFAARHAGQFLQLQYPLRRYAPRALPFLYGLVSHPDCGGD